MRTRRRFLSTLDRSSRSDKLSRSAFKPLTRLFIFARTEISSSLEISSGFRLEREELSDVDSELAGVFAGVGALGSGPIGVWESFICRLVLEGVPRIPWPLFSDDGFSFSTLVSFPSISL